MKSPIVLLFCLCVSCIFGQSNPFYENLPVGKYAVGFKIFSFIDSSRVSKPRFDYFNTEEKGDLHRKITVHLWYPARPNTINNELLASNGYLVAMVVIAGGKQPLAYLGDVADMQQTVTTFHKYSTKDCKKTTTNTSILIGWKPHKCCFWTPDRPTSKLRPSPIRLASTPFLLSMRYSKKWWVVPLRSSKEWNNIKKSFIN